MSVLQRPAGDVGGPGAAWRQRGPSWRAGAARLERTPAHRFVLSVDPNPDGNGESARPAQGRESCRPSASRPAHPLQAPPVVSALPEDAGRAVCAYSCCVRRR